MHLQTLSRILFFSLLTALLIFISGSLTNVISKDAIEVTRDKDKTTYSIGSSENKNNEKTEEEKDKERAWDMLNKMNKAIDNRHQDGQRNGQQGGK